MAIDAWHELGPVAGRCTLCGTEDRLRLGEFRSRPDLLERLRGERAAPTARLVLCHGCGWRLPVRLDDSLVTAGAAAVGRGGTSRPRREGEALDEPGPGRRAVARPLLTARVPPEGAGPGRHAASSSGMRWPRACHRRSAHGSA